MSARYISFQSLRFSHRNPTFARSSGNTRPTWSGALPMSGSAQLQVTTPYRLKELAQILQIALCELQKVAC